VILGRWTLDSSPIYVAMDLMSRLLSPYQLNPKGKNPLREILADLVDFERLAQSSLFWQSHDHAPHPGVQIAGHYSRYDQPD
jgi:hypothetical protein